MHASAILAIPVPDLDDPPNVPQDLGNAVAGLEPYTIARFGTVAARNAAWPAVSAPIGVACITTDTMTRWALSSTRVWVQQTRAMVFPDRTTRNAYPAAAGDTCITLADGASSVYNNFTGNWLWTPPWNQPWGVLEHFVNSQNTGAVAAETVILGSAAFTTFNGRCYEVSATAAIVKLTSTSMARAKLRLDSVTGAIMASTLQSITLNTWWTPLLYGTGAIPAGSHRMMITLSADTDTARIDGTVSGTLITIKDVGPMTFVPV